MTKTLLLLTLFRFTITPLTAQEKDVTQPLSLGIHFIFNDFETAKAIRESSLASVLKDHRFGKLRDMSQGLAISIGKGISPTFDFYSTFAGSFLSYPFTNRTSSGTDFLLIEADASVRGKMLPDKYFFVPYLQIGAGISKYQGYWGTFIPFGVGIQFNFFDEAYLQINSQYRVGLTENTSYHFVHGIGLVGNIGNWKDE